MELVIYKDVLRSDGVNINNENNILTITHLDPFDKYVKFNFYIPSLSEITGTKLVSGSKVNWDNRSEIEQDELYALLYSGKIVPGDVSMKIKDRKKVNIIKKFEYYTVEADYGCVLDTIYLVKLDLKVNQDISFYMAYKNFKGGQCHYINIRKTDKGTKVEERRRYYVSKKERVIHLSNLL